MAPTAILRAEGEAYVALCPEVDVASQGATIEAAVDNLREAVELFLEDEDAQVPDGPTLITVFEVQRPPGAA